MLCNGDLTRQVKLDGHEYTITRARLGLYLRLMHILEDGINAVTVRKYILECGLPAEGRGIELLRLFRDLVRFNQVDIQLAAFKKPVAHREGNEDAPWDYVGRWTISWVHIIANAYHWSRNEIMELHVEEAAAYIQEIMVQNQLDHEWVYSLSEQAWQPTPDGKYKKLQPLPRPFWMKKPRPPQPAIPKWMLPVGLVVDPRYPETLPWNNASKSSTS